MTVREQNEFSTQVCKLILEAKQMGYQVTLGDAFRDPRLHGAMGVKMGYGAANSFHKTRMAIDLNLFDKAGKFLSTTEDHAKLGAWWESIGGTWGGNFKSKDGNHYSWGEGK